tara:strand:- start:331 stop:585 length:255 start_codon:yes stop_codon:yes gene_type:complete
MIKRENNNNNNNNDEVNMSKINLIEDVGLQFDNVINKDIWINGIQGIDSILTMIKDRIDDGDIDGAVDDINQLQNQLLENNVRL